MVIRDHNANVLGILRAPKNLTNNHFVAKALALHIAIQFCKKIGFHNIVLDRDALHVVNLMQLKAQIEVKEVCLSQMLFTPSLLLLPGLFIM